MDQEIVLKDKQIDQMKRDNESLVKQLFNCEDKPGWDKFFWGFIGAVGVIVIGVTVGTLIKF